MPPRARMPDVARAYFRQEGARGGHTAAANMTAAQRAARSRKGALAAVKARQMRAKKATRS